MLPPRFPPLDMLLYSFWDLLPIPDTLIVSVKNVSAQGMHAKFPLFLICNATNTCSHRTIKSPYFSDPHMSSAQQPRKKIILLGSETI